MKRLKLTGLAIVWLMGCRDATGPLQQRVTVTTDRAVSRDISAGAVATLSDATGRIIPSLADHVAGARIQQHLEHFINALVAGNTRQAQRALELARTAVTRYRNLSPSGTDAAPDLSAIDLGLDQGEAYLQSQKDTAPRDMLAQRFR